MAVWLADFPPAFPQAVPLCARVVHRVVPRWGPPRVYGGTGSCSFSCPEEAVNPEPGSWRFQSGGNHGAVLPVATPDVPRGSPFARAHSAVSSRGPQPPRRAPVPGLQAPAPPASIGGPVGQSSDSHPPAFRCLQPAAPRQDLRLRLRAATDRSLQQRLWRIGNDAPGGRIDSRHNRAEVRDER